MAHYAPFPASQGETFATRVPPQFPEIIHPISSHMFARLLALTILACCSLCSGCAFHRPIAPANPIFVAATNEDAVWERTVDVVHEYFDISRENRIVGSQPGVIETQYKVGAGLLEPWHKDSPGLESRFESTAQSIRRKAYFNVAPAEGGYLISIEVFKEIEDLPGVANNTAGGATFQQGNPLRRDLDLVVGQSSPSGWVVKGRDEVLEAEISRRLQYAFSR